MRGNAARPVSAPTLCPCKSRARRGLAARMLLVRQGRVLEASRGAAFRRELPCFGPRFASPLPEFIPAAARLARALEALS